MGTSVGNASENDAAAIRELLKSVGIKDTEFQVGTASPGWLLDGMYP